MIASFLESNAFAVAGDRTVEFSPGVRVLADCGADGARYGTVAAALYAAEGDLTTVTLTLDGDGLTANLAAVLHGNDVPASLANHGHAGPADGGLIGTATPTANAHPLASALGKLTDWIDAATTGLAGIVKLATTAMCQAGTDTTTAVTPAGLAASVKGLITSNTTINVAATGSDTGGDGTTSKPFASIAKALASIAGKLIASGLTVTIQVADGTYAIASTIVIDHPDADKIQILGNTSAETTVPISAIDTTAKTITVAGDYTASILVGDIIGLTGSSTSGLNGAYVASSVTYSGGNTIITCAAETFASATVGGGSIIIKPCNRCVLNVSADVRAFYFYKGVKLVNGFRINLAGNGAGLYFLGLGKSSCGAAMITVGGQYGVFAQEATTVGLLGGIVKGMQYGLFANAGGTISVYSQTIVDSCTTTAVRASSWANMLALSSAMILRNNAANYSPALNTVGNGNSYISSTY